MMSNEVIIDGVNVAECEFYQIEANELYPKAQYCGSMRNTFCENEPNCYFKQLQQAKAELEQYKIKYPIIDCYRCKNSRENKVLKAENDKLKAELEQYKKSKQASYESMQEQWNKAVNELRDLKATDQIKFKQFYKAQNDKLKAENEWLNNANRKFLLDKDFLTSEHRDLRIEYAKLYQLNEKLKQALEEVEKYCNECNLKADYTACEVLKIINEVLTDVGN